MPIYVDTFPQKVNPIKTTTLKQLVTLLPKVLPYEKIFWIGGKMAIYGRTSGNLVFIVEGEPTTEMMQYFDSLVQPLGINATVDSFRKGDKTQRFRLYNDGRLIIDKETMTYIELPTEVKEEPVLTIEEALSKMPKTIPWKQTLYLTGGLVANGWSGNDGDIISDPVDKSELPLIKKFFTEAIGWKFDIGLRVMTEREPVYKKKLYVNGTLCQ